MNFRQREGEMEWMVVEFICAAVRKCRGAVRGDGWAQSMATTVPAEVIPSLVRLGSVAN